MIFFMIIMMDENKGYRKLKNGEKIEYREKQNNSLTKYNLV